MIEDVVAHVTSLAGAGLPISPDGRWAAYVSDESGIEQVYVKPIGQSGRYRVSAGGGVQPRWRGDARELF